MDAVLVDSFNRLLDEAAAPALVRAAEADGLCNDAWAIVRASGFADALVPEEHGGFGLAIDDVVLLLLAAAERALPIPLGETMVARTLLRMSGGELAADLPVLLWPSDAQGLRSALPPAAAGPAFVLRQVGEEIGLTDMRVTDERDGFGFLCAAPADMAPHFTFRAAPDLLFNWAAALTAVSMAGSIRRLVAMAVQHANDRSQFGRPLSKFQAIQQQISVLAEQSAIASVGARTAFKGADLRAGPSRWRVSAARSVAGEAAATGAAIAHAVHGAIGISREHDLQLITRRLKRLQASFGGRDFWSHDVGVARLRQESGTTVDFIRSSGYAEARA